MKRFTLGFITGFLALVAWGHLAAWQHELARRTGLETLLDEAGPVR